jgi:flagellar motor protein MotB
MKNWVNSFNYLSLRKNFVICCMAVTLAGCSTIPTSLNPSEWYKGARDIIMGDDTEKKEKSEQNNGRLSGNRKNDGFAKLSSVPARPKTLSSEERKAIKGGLVADHDASRKYSNEIVGRQSKSENLSTLSEVKVEQAVIPSSAREALKPEVMVKPLRTSNTNPELGTKYLVPPKPVKVRPYKNKTKLSSEKSMPLLSSKLSVSQQLKVKKLPKFNPKPPRIGMVPGFDEDLARDQTIVISGSGVQQLNFTERDGRRAYRLPPSSMNSSRVDLSGQKDANKFQKSYQVATILFPNGSSKVGKKDRRVLRKVISEYRKVVGRLRIVGHASRRSATNDPILHKMTNFQVSAARAERVAKELLKMGVRADKLFVGSVSDRDPRYYEYMPSGEAGNRRAEIFIDLL